MVTHFTIYSPDMASSKTPEVYVNSDPKSTIMDWCRKFGYQPITDCLMSGPDHMRVYKVSLYAPMPNSHVRKTQYGVLMICSGMAKTKKEAERKACSYLIDLLKAYDDGNLTDLLADYCFNCGIDYIEMINEMEMKGIVHETRDGLTKFREGALVPILPPTFREFVPSIKKDSMIKIPSNDANQVTKTLEESLPNSPQQGVLVKYTRGGKERPWLRQVHIFVDLDNMQRSLEFIASGKVESLGFDFVLWHIYYSSMGAKAALDKVDIRAKTTIYHATAGYKNDADFCICWDTCKLMSSLSRENRAIVLILSADNGLRSVSARANDDFRVTKHGICEYVQSADQIMEFVSKHINID